MKSGIFAMIGFAAFVSFAKAADDVAPILGFTAASSKTQREWEKKFTAFFETQFVAKLNNELHLEPTID